MHRLLLTVVCSLFLSSAAGRAQPTSSKDAASPVPVTLGDSSAELSGKWKFHTGDNPAWAQTNYDDSSWGSIDLSASPDDPNGLAAGWTEQGYPGYSGFAWYRLRVDVQGARSRLALKMPDSFDDAYQVFVNGRLLGEFGNFTSNGVTAYSALSRKFPLPKEIRGGPITIAVRMWMDSASPFNSPDAGGMHGAPVLGHADAITTQMFADWYAAFHSLGSGFLETIVLLLALGVSLTHFWMDRTDKAYLWLSLVSFVTFVGNTIVLCVSFVTWIPQTFATILADVIVTPLRIGLWVFFWAYWFRVGPARWLQRAIVTCMLLLAAGYLALRPPLYGQVVPVHAAAFLSPLLVTIKLALAGLLFWVTYKGIRKQRYEGWLALPAVLLAAAANYQHELRILHIKTSFILFGYAISLGTASTMLSLSLVTLLLSRRFLRSQRQQERWGWEVEQAREVQRVLIPQQLSQVPGLTIQGEYRPAREVGGDFFQIIPIASGGILIIVGDVTGKGLCAGMLVALIVGVIHTAAELQPDPLAVLHAINERLYERAGASATCLALRIDSDGLVSIANAGHLPPYLNGTEVPLEGALPLGIVAGMTYSVEHFQLNAGDNLMLMSDGVVEAQNEDGKLFGFDRVQEMLRHPITAADLATAAQTFGQEDDILVLSVQRNLVATEVPVPERAIVLS